ncbi:MAG TPA: hypothetical protein VGD77_00770 [Gemmatimonadaceae bacterium]
MRPMGWISGWHGCVVGVAMMLLPAAARAQLATPLQGLSFGTLMAGVPDQVTLQDAARRAEVNLDPAGAFNAVVGVRFILPAAMIQSSTGRQLPLTFGTADAGIYDPKTGRLQPFDPAVGTSYRLKKSPVMIYLAGTAVPGAAQRAGPYSASVTLLITNPAQ